MAGTACDTHLSIQGLVAAIQAVFSIQLKNRAHLKTKFPAIVIVVAIIVSLVYRRGAQRAPEVLTVGKHAPVATSEVAREILSTGSMQHGMPGTAVPSRQPPNESDPATEVATIAQQIATTVGLTNQVSFLERLAVIGGDEAADVVLSVISSDYNGASFDFNEEVAMTRAIFCLGLISRNSARALDFLRVHVDEDRWERERTCSYGHRPATHVGRDLAATCLTALGAGGRPEMWDEISRIQANNHTPLTTWRWATMIMSAVFRFDLSRTMTPQQLVDLNGDESFELYLQWKSSDRDKELKAWCARQISEGRKGLRTRSK